jgi:membrane protein involved in colicin uptake
MKYLNAIVSLIIAAAVLVAAYAIGLLIRHARTAGTQAVAQMPAGPNDGNVANATAAGQKTGPPVAERTDDKTGADLERRRAEELERMKNLAEEKKQQFRDRLRQRMSGPARERLARLSPEERREMEENLRTMSPDERRAFEARLRGREAGAGSDANAAADANTAEEMAAASDFEPNEPNEK